MFKKVRIDIIAYLAQVNVKEKLVGWYSSGPKLKLNDIQINEVFKKYMTDPVLVVVDVEMIV